MRMRKLTHRSVSLVAASITLAILLSSTVLAGPPLVCWPFDIGNAKSLPWQGPGWRGVKADYDVHRLVQDTLALLTPDQPVIARMETIRRAAVFATQDQSVARDLYERLAKRARDASGPAAALAIFDEGYLAETYKQTRGISPIGALVNDADGYSMAVKAISLRHGDSEMEFAAALINSDRDKNKEREHLRNALAGASEGSLLARNLVSHFSHLGRTIGELRSSAGLAKR